MNDTVKELMKETTVIRGHRLELIYPVTESELDALCNAWPWQARKIIQGIRAQTNFKIEKADL